MSRLEGETMNTLKLAGLLVLTCLATSCATVTTGTSQTITVETEPPGASCKMTRDNETIGVVNPTPGSVTIGKDKDDIDISCELSGYHTTTKNLDSSFQGMTLGNVILGGIIGIAIDAGSGAMNEYPSSISLRLMPENFPSVEERDQYFDGLVREVNENTEKIAQGKKYNCTTSSCKKRLDKLNTQRDTELADIESARSEARIQTQ